MYYYINVVTNSLPCESSSTEKKTMLHNDISKHSSSYSSSSNSVVVEGDFSMSKEERDMPIDDFTTKINVIPQF